MADIARLFDFQEGDLIVDSQVDSELNQLVAAVNAKPDADTTLQDDLNADMLDGFHASEAGGTDTIPVCNGDVQTDLNAEMVGGLTAADLAEAGFPAGTKLPFYQAAAPSGWQAEPRPAIDRVFGWAASGATAGGTNNGSSATTPAWSALGSSIELAIDNHTLTLSEIPAHTHSGFGSSSGADSFYAAQTPSSAISANSTGYVTNTAGGGQGHNHTGTAGVSNSWRPPISWFIICSKT